MHFHLSIDDTDNLDSPGSGQLAEVLAKELEKQKLVTQYTNITRHQLFVHDDIPYTSHNSSMCFIGTTEESKLDDVIEFSKQFLVKASAPGSDPGLCIGVDKPSLDRESLKEFGANAKKNILTKQEAYFLAQKTGIHLSEHGGTGDGIVGALAGVGLRLTGNDGRFRGWLKPGAVGDITTSQALCSHPDVDGVINDRGYTLPENAKIILTDKTVKTIMHNHHQVIPVTRANSSNGSYWQTLTRKEVKRF